MTDRQPATPLSRRLRALMAPGRRESGVAEASVIFPFLIILTLTAFQLGLWYHAGNTAKAAAAVAYNGAHALQASSTLGESAAHTFLADHSGELRSAQVTVTRSATQVTVRVTGQAPGVVPGWEWLDVEGTYTGPVERWTN